MVARPTSGVTGGCLEFGVTHLRGECLGTKSSRGLILQSEKAAVDRNQIHRETVKGKRNERFQFTIPFDRESVCRGRDLDDTDDDRSDADAEHVYGRGVLAH